MHPARPARPAPLNIRAAADDRTEVLVYGPIGDWETSADEVARQLAGITTSAIDVRINSTGGLAWDGCAIYTALVRHPAEVTTHVDGIAASAASIIMQAGEQRVVSEPARVMIHAGSGAVYGRAVDMREMADILDGLDESMAGVYAARSGGEPAHWRAAMDAATWYSADQAVEAGLADEVAAAQGPTASLRPSGREQRLRARHRVRAARKG
jgi:ATP-dependent protease ClpP protease subunit